MYVYLSDQNKKKNNLNLSLSFMHSGLFEIMYSRIGTTLDVYGSFYPREANSRAHR